MKVLRCEALLREIGSSASFHTSTVTPPDRTRWQAAEIAAQELPTTRRASPRGPWEHQPGVASDVRLIVSHALRNPTLGRYSHYLPRTPSAVKDHVMDMEEVRHTIRLVRAGIEGKADRQAYVVRMKLMYTFLTLSG